MSNLGGQDVVLDAVNGDELRREALRIDVYAVIAYENILVAIGAICVDSAVCNPALGAGLIEDPNLNRLHYGAVLRAVL